MKFHQAEIAVSVDSGHLIHRLSDDIDQLINPESGHAHCHADVNRCAAGRKVAASLHVNQNGFREAGTHDFLGVDVGGCAWTDERQVTDDDVDAILKDTKLAGGLVVRETRTNKRRVTT